MDVKAFLKEQISFSLESLVVGIAEILKADSPFEGGGDIAVTKIRAAVKVMRGMALVEELRLLVLLLVAKCGEKGIPIDWIDEIAGEVKLAPATEPQRIALVEKPSALAPVEPTKLAPVPTPVAIAQVATPTPTPTVPAKPVEIKTAPARNLADGNAFGEWRKLLTGFLNNVQTDFKKLQLATARIFNEGHPLNDSNWSDLFTAMKKAAGLGKFIVGKEANPFRVFSLAPVGMLDSYIFGQDGILTQVTAEVADHVGYMPPWMVAKSAITLDAIRALQINLKSKTSMGFDEQCQQRVEKLVKALEEKNAPHGVLETAHQLIGAVVSTETLEDVHKQAAVPNPAMAAALAAALPAKLAPAPIAIVPPTQPSAKTLRKQARRARQLAAQSVMPAEKYASEIPVADEGLLVAVVQESLATPDSANLSDNGPDKPATLDHDFEAEYAAMLAAEEAKNQNITETLEESVITVMKTPVYTNGAPAVPLELIVDASNTEAISAMATTN